jgi:hypothetical protein
LVKKNPLVARVCGRSLLYLIRGSQAGTGSRKRHLLEALCGRALLSLAKQCYYGTKKLASGTKRQGNGTITRGIAG